MSKAIWPTIVLGALALSALGAEVVPKEKSQPKFRTESIQGRVVWMGEALKEHFGISTVEEAQQRVLAIQTKDGRLLPMVEDLRGRSFRTDERLRNKPMELIVRRHKKQPMLQVIRIYEFREGKKYEVDYWCDVCAIVMFEKGFCACCQDNNRLRHRFVKPTSRSLEPAKSKADKKSPATTPGGNN